MMRRAIPAGEDQLRVSDRLRSLALASSCAAFVAIPVLGPVLTGRGEQTDPYDTVVTPPGYAFTIWAPIFLGCGVDALRQCLPGDRHAESARRSGWPLAGAYTTNAIWSVAAQSGRFGLTPFLLPVATSFSAVAFARLQQLDPGSSRCWDTASSTGFLLGWTSLASAVNILAGFQLLGARRDAPRTMGLALAGVATTGAALTAAVHRSRRGFLPLAAAAGWGLLTNATDRTRPRPVRVASAVSAAAVLGSALARWRVVRSAAAHGGQAPSSRRA
jgi:hypothetical protein